MLHLRPQDVKKEVGKHIRENNDRVRWSNRKEISM